MLLPQWSGPANLTLDGRDICQHARSQSREGNRSDQGSHIGVPAVSHRDVEKGCTGARIQSLGSAACLGHQIGPFGSIDNSMEEVYAVRFFRVKGTSLLKNLPSDIGTDAVDEAPRPKHNPKAKTRHAEHRCGGSDAPGTGADEISAGPEDPAVGQSYRDEWSVIDGLEQGLDTNESEYEVCIALLLDSCEVEPSRKTGAIAFQHQEAGSIFFRIAYGLQQTLYER